MAQGFLSYTRRDDAFFENRITALRALVEQAVHVHTGEDRFRLFQDREGIATGEDWEGKLHGALANSVVMLPVLTPSFLASEWCRRELDLFLAREAELGRGDLVLPVYLVTTPPLEAEAKRQGDPLAVALARRQRADWRALADMPLDRQRVRKAARALAQDIAAAVERSASASHRPQSGRPPVGAAERPSGARAPAASAGFEAAVETLVASAGATAAPVGSDGFAAGSRGRRPGAPDDGAAPPGVRPAPPARARILWVDDAPHKNLAEIAALREHGVAVEPVSDTRAALDCLCAPGAGFTAVVSDMARPGDGTAGWTLLEAARAQGHPQPFLIYAGRDDPARRAGTLARGGQAYATRAAEIVALALDAATGRAPPP